MAKWLKRFFASLHLCGKTRRMEAFEPSDSDIEQVVDASRKAEGLGPAPRSPGQGIADMDARIHELTELKRQFLNREAPDEEISKINRQIAEACARRLEYEAQLKGKN
jgi:hypothetical protein